MSRAPRRGNVTLLAATAVALFAMAALVVDLGFLYAAQTQIQVATDAAALAGVGYLDQTAAGVQTAREKAVFFAGEHQVFGETLVLPPAAISTGYLDADGAFVQSHDPLEITALSIDHTQVDIPVWFARVAFGRSSLSASTHSIAARSPRRGARMVGCYLPLAIPDCVLEDPPAFQNMTLRLSSSGNDNVGWADLSANPTGPRIEGNLLGMCTSGEPAIGDPVYLNNGTIASALQDVGRVLNDFTSADTTPWDDTLWGPIPAQQEGSDVVPGEYGQNVLEGPILLFETPPGTCLSGTQFNQTKPITGFAWAVLYDVVATGGDKNIQVRLDLVNEHPWGTSGGGPDGNVTAYGIAVLVE